MRDILICKECEHFREYGNRHSGTIYEFSLGKEVRYGLNKRMHVCYAEDSLWDRHMVHAEFYKLNCDDGCPYFVEQCVSSCNNDFDHEVDYGIKRFFKKTRVCQHCGRVIPRKDFTCPVCGYDEFKNYSKWAEMTLAEKTEYVCEWIAFPTVLLVFYCYGKLKGLFKQKEKK